MTAATIRNGSESWAGRVSGCPSVFFSMLSLTHTPRVSRMCLQFPVESWTGTNPIGNLAFRDRRGAVARVQMHFFLLQCRRGCHSLPWWLLPFSTFPQRCQVLTLVFV